MVAYVYYSYYLPPSLKSGILWHEGGAPEAAAQDDFSSQSSLSVIVYPDQYQRPNPVIWGHNTDFAETPAAAAESEAGQTWKARPLRLQWNQLLSFTAGEFESAPAEEETNPTWRSRPLRLQWNQLLSFTAGDFEVAAAEQQVESGPTWAPRRIAYQYQRLLNFTFTENIAEVPQEGPPVPWLGRKLQRPYNAYPWLYITQHTGEFAEATPTGDEILQPWKARTLKVEWDQLLSFNSGDFTDTAAAAAAQELGQVWRSRPLSQHFNRLPNFISGDFGAAPAEAQPELGPSWRPRPLYQRYNQLLNFTFGGFDDSFLDVAPTWKPRVLARQYNSRAAWFYIQQGQSEDFAPGPAAQVHESTLEFWSPQRLQNRYNPAPSLFYIAQGQAKNDTFVAAAVQAEFDFWRAQFLQNRYNPKPSQFYIAQGQSEDFAAATVAGVPTVVQWSARFVRVSRPPRFAFLRYEIQAQTGESGPIAPPSPRTIGRITGLIDQVRWPTIIR